MEEGKESGCEVKAPEDAPVPEPIKNTTPTENGTVESEKPNAEPPNNTDAAEKDTDLDDIVNSVVGDGSEPEKTEAKAEEEPESKEKKDTAKEEEAEKGEARETIRGKILIEHGITGTVKWFNVVKNYGFITRDDVEKDIFVHGSSIVRANPDKWERSLDDGEKVVFAVVDGRKGPEAADVTGPDGGNVKGSRFARDKTQPFPFRRWRPFYTGDGMRDGGGRGSSGGGSGRIQGPLPREEPQGRYYIVYHDGRGGPVPFRFGSQNVVEGPLRNMPRFPIIRGREIMPNGGMRRGSAGPLMLHPPMQPAYIPTRGGRRFGPSTVPFHRGDHPRTGSGRFVGRGRSASDVTERHNRHRSPSNEDRSGNEKEGEGRREVKPRRKSGRRMGRRRKDSGDEDEKEHKEGSDVEKKEGEARGRQDSRGKGRKAQGGGRYFRRKRGSTPTRKEGEEESTVDDVEVIVGGEKKADGGVGGEKKADGNVGVEKKADGGSSEAAEKKVVVKPGQDGSGDAKEVSAVET